METIILRGGSESDTRLILELAKKLNFSIRKISEKEAEELGLYYSVKEGMESGLLAEEEKEEFLNSLKPESDEN